jgi:hypothetical protein
MPEPLDIVLFSRQAAHRERNTDYGTGVMTEEQWAAKVTRASRGVVLLIAAAKTHLLRAKEVYQEQALRNDRASAIMPVFCCRKDYPGPHGQSMIAPLEQCEPPYIGRDAFRFSTMLSQASLALGYQAFDKKVTPACLGADFWFFRPPTKS